MATLAPNPGGVADTGCTPSKQQINKPDDKPAVKVLLRAPKAKKYRYGGVPELFS